MNKSTVIMSSILLVCASQGFADRPGLEGRYSENNDSMQGNRASAPAQETMIQQSVGDLIEISEGETIDVKPLDFPSRGMSMKKVLNELGKPKKTIAAVGKPPIRKWIYDDRTVYFEEMTVVHVVATP